MLAIVVPLLIILPLVIIFMYIIVGVSHKPNITTIDDTINHDSTKVCSTCLYYTPSEDKAPSGKCNIGLSIKPVEANHSCIYHHNRSSN